MNLSRYVPALILAFALGAVVSGLAGQWRLSALRDTMAVETATLKEELTSKKHLETHVHTLEADLARMERELAAAREAARRAAQEASESLVTDVFPALPPEPVEDLARTDGEPQNDARTDWRGRWESLSEEEREAMMDRRREFMSGFQERISAFLDDRMMQSTDQYEQERMAALQEYMAYMGDLRRQMREAASEEEREQLGELMRQSGEEMIGIMRDQQNHLLLQVAREYGITDPQKQGEFINRMQDLRQDPFFQGPMMYGGGGFRGGRGRGDFFGPGTRP